MFKGITGPIAAHCINTDRYKRTASNVMRIVTQQRLTVHISQKSKELSVIQRERCPFSTQVCYRQAPVASFRSRASWRWERKRGVPPRSASWCSPRCWEENGCAGHTGTQCCDYPVRGGKNTRVHDMETVWKSIGAEKFLDLRGGETLSSDGNCWWTLDRTIKEAELRRRGTWCCGRGIRSLSSLQQPAGHRDVSDSLVILPWQRWH